MMTNKDAYAYIQLSGVAKPSIKNLDENNKDFKDGIYEMFETKNLAIKEYFMKWERLIIELQKFT